MEPHHAAPYALIPAYAEITSNFVINIISLLSQESVGPTPLLTHSIPPPASESFIIINLLQEAWERF